MNTKSQRENKKIETTKAYIWRNFMPEPVDNKNEKLNGHN